MSLVHGIGVEATVTVDRTCDISCNVAEDEIQLIFGRDENGLRLYLDWATLDRLMTVVGATAKWTQMEPQRKHCGFMISADGSSRKQHRPNYPHAEDNELLVSDVDNQAGRQPPA
jgi:hypothetical protein